MSLEPYKRLEQLTLRVLRNETLFLEKNIDFVDKNSKAMAQDLQRIISRRFGFGDLVLRNPETMEEVARIHNLKELQDTIMEKPENIYLIEEMAEDSQVSPYHMIRKFKKAFGLTPHQFQIQCKVRKAQKLLETTKSIPEVAYEAGFCDQSHLDRCFQKIVGMTPRQYQDALINND